MTFNRLRNGIVITSCLLAMVVLFGAVVGALLVFLQKLRHAASVERADAVLAAEVDALDQGPR